MHDQGCQTELNLVGEAMQVCTCLTCPHKRRQACSRCLSFLNLRSTDVGFNKFKLKSKGSHAVTCFS